MLLLASCPSPLLNQIEEAVVEVVTPPAVLSVFPGIDGQDIATNLENISVTFSKAIQAGSVTAATFKVTAEDGTTITGLFKVTNDTVTFEPNGTLDFSTTYTVTISGILDSDGNPLSVTYTWTFTTGLAPDTEKPTGDYISIANDSTWTTTHSVLLEIKGSDNYGVAQVFISDTNDFSGENWITYDPETEDDPIYVNYTLPDGDGTKTVYAKFKDGAGLVSESSVSDTINVDTTPPTVEYFEINGGDSATKELLVTIGITGADAEGSSGVTQYELKNAGDDWTDTWVNLVDNKILVPDVALPDTFIDGDEQTFEARVKDLAGNISEVIARTIRYDLGHPGAPSVNPVEGDTNVPYDIGIIEAVFTEEMEKDSFTLDTFYLIEAGEPDPIEGTHDLLDVNQEVGVKAEFHIENALKPNTDYFVTITTGVTDVAGNALNEDKTWFFRTGNATDVTAPVGEIIISGFNGGEPVGAKFHNYTYSGGEYTGVSATTYEGLVLEIIADDDYNMVYGMNDSVDLLVRQCA